MTCQVPTHQIYRKQCKNRKSPCTISNQNCPKY